MRHGFTLIEILIVLAISVMLTGIAITYSSIGRQQVALTVAQSQVAQVILRAKDLAVATYSEVPGECGYGAYFDVPDNTYSIFAFVPGGGCGSVASTTANGIQTNEIVPAGNEAWNVSLGTNVRLASTTNNNQLLLVMFYPPQPDVFMVLADATSTFLQPDSTSSKVYLTTADGSASTSITVDAQGGVTF